MDGWNLALFCEFVHITKLFIGNYGKKWAQIWCHIYPYINKCSNISRSLNPLMKLRYHIILYLICIRWVKSSLILCVCAYNWMIHRKLWPQVGPNQKYNVKCKSSNKSGSLNRLMKLRYHIYILYAFIWLKPSLVLWVCMYNWVILWKLWHKVGSN